MDLRDRSDQVVISSTILFLLVMRNSYIKFRKPISHQISSNTDNPLVILAWLLILGGLLILGKRNEKWMCRHTAHVCTKKVFYARTCTHIFKALSTPKCTKISAPAHVRAQAHTRTLMVFYPGSSPDFLLKLMKSFIHFGQIWSNLMKKEIVIFILMLQSTMYSTELHIRSKSNSFVIMGLSKTVASLINTLS